MGISKFHENVKASEVSVNSSFYDGSCKQLRRSHFFLVVKVRFQHIS